MDRWPPRLASSRVICASLTMVAVLSMADTAKCGHPNNSPTTTHNHEAINNKHYINRSINNSIGGSSSNNNNNNNNSNPFLGINYGTMANNLPPPSQVVTLLQAHTTISKVKLFDADPNILAALANTGIEVVIGIANFDIPILGGRARANRAIALDWVKSYVAPFLPATRIVAIAVGNEVLAARDKVILAHLVPTMQNLYNALAYLGLDSQIKVSSPHTLGLLHTSFPPSQGAFRENLLKPFILPMLSFLANTSSPFMANVYPFFGYLDHPTSDILSYALFTSSVGYTDPFTQLHYSNMFDAQLDALYSALSRVGYNNMSVVVSETGWPSMGDADQPGVSVTYAQTYTNNLIKHIASNQGTPLRPNSQCDIYIFALFNEDMKPGPTSERNYGIFKPDMTPVYTTSLLSNNQQVSLHSTPTSMLPTSSNTSNPPTTLPSPFSLSSSPSTSIFSTISIIAFVYFFF